MGDLAADLRAGVEALRAGKPAEAVALLEPVVRDREFSRAPDLQDIRARVCSLLAQALLDVGRPRDAEQWAATSLRILRQHPDQQGQAEVRELQERIEAAVQAGAGTVDPLMHALVRAKTADELVAGVDDPARRSDLLVRKANDHLDHGRVADARSVAERALTEALSADWVRGVVFSHLTLARIAPDDAQSSIMAALAAADAASEATLVTAVAKAAALHGVVIPEESI